MTLTPEDIAAGWVEWGGGDCPLADDTLVEVRTLDPDEGDYVTEFAEGAYTAGFWKRPADWWKHEHQDGTNIIAYRIITPPHQKETP